jgi:hypothetical protein
MVKNSRTHEGKVFVEFSTQTCFIKPFDDIFDMKIGRTVAGEFRFHSAAHASAAKGASPHAHDTRPAAALAPPLPQIP